MRKHLRELHTIDLTGLRAERELEVELESKPYARYTKKVAVDKLEKGAYLVLVKSGDTVRSSIIIVSSLQATARRDGNVLRVTVTKADGSPVAGAWVKVSDGNRIVANGKTDVRGIFQSNGGNVVLVERNGEYALLPDVGND